VKTSREGLLEIVSHEGIVPYPYKDSVGVWTFGVGHTKYAGHPDPFKLTRGQAYPLDFCMDLFQEDIQKYEKRVNKAVTVELKQHEFDALVSFDYNTGGIYRAKLTKALNAGDRPVNVAKHFLGWIKPKEIIGRRRKEMRLFLHGTYTSNGLAPVYRADMKGNIIWKSARKVNVSEIWDN